MLQTVNDKVLTTTKILAQVLHDLNPARTVDEWEQHCITTGHDPALFFAGNGEGQSEYEAFVKTNDRDNYLRNRKQTTLRRN